ncbi:MAG: hypothetical protein ABSB58_05990 [Gemmatimonadales bacterium]|jgi:DUF4097 and DUF4098 domain-containing protein YvlB
MTARLPLLAALLLLAGLAMPGALAAQRRPQRTAEDWLADCGSHRDDGDRVRACEVRETGFRSQGRTIQLDAGPNGAVVVTGWDRDSVHVRAVVQAWAATDSDATGLLREVHVDVSGTSVTSDGPAIRRREGWAVHLEVSVPRRSDVTAETVNGPVSAEDVAGKLDLRTVNGPLTLSGVAGDVHAHTSNGSLTVDLAGTRWEGAGLDAETQNGPATLAIPDGYSAELETGTVNGPMQIDFPITLQGRIGRTTRIRTTLGSGGPPVRVVTTNGPLSVRRR